MDRHIMQKQTKTKVYDFPTRIFHGIFAVLFLAAFLFAETAEEDSFLFSFHMLAGLTIGFLLILRLIWGFIGTAYARFSSFRLNPVELLQYLKDALIAKTKQYIGHNPASSYAALIMFVCAAGLAFTGILMAGGSEIHLYEEIHEVLANLFLISVIAHIAGIIFHEFKHKDALWSSMFDGKKKLMEGENGIKSSRLKTGIVLMMLIVVWSGYLYNRYDRGAQSLNLFGHELVLGEEEHAAAVSGGDADFDYDENDNDEE